MSSISSTISDEGRVYILGRNALPKNFIEDGLEILPGTGLSAKISTGTLDIGGIYLDLSSDTSIDLSPRMAALLYAKYQPGTEYPTIGKVNCVNPLTFVDANTVGLWIFNQTTAGVAIPNSAVGVSSIAVANDLTPFGGLTSVDGHFDYAIKGDGTSGYYISANSTGIPTGALEFHHTCLFTPKSFAATQYLLSYGTHTASNTQVSIVIDMIGTLFVQSSNSVSNSTGFTLELGKTYLLDVTYTGSAFVLYINGNKVYSVSITLAVSSSIVSIGQHVTGTSRFNSVIHYIELRNKVRTSAQIGAIANKLCLPCSYQTTYQEEYIGAIKCYDISTPENAISGGDYSGSPKQNAFDKTNSSTTWASSQIYTGVSGVAYIGQRVDSKIKKIRHLNCNQDSGNISSVLVQWSADGLTNWTTIQTQALPVTANADAVYDVADYAATGTHYVRELANANPSGSSSPWYVYELKMYTNVKPAAIDIRSILPADSISLGRVLTGTSTIKEIRTDYQDGRREGAVGGNRKKFLGWKYFSGATQLSWSNPFGTRKVEPCYTWAQDANGTNESPVMSGFNSGTSPVHEYGIRNYGSNVTPFVAYTGADGVACVNTFQTSGYIGCYAKCLEEDE